MKGDVSRAVFDERRFSRVVAQQGRMQLDADWNEQQAIIDYRLRTMMADIFGHGGLIARAVAPRERAGFGIHVHHGCAIDAGTALPAIDVTGSLSVDASGRRTPFSIEFWIKPAPASGGGVRTIAARRLAADRGEVRVGLDAQQRIHLERAVANATAWETTVSRCALRPDAFSYVVAVCTADAVEIWIDGALDVRVAARAQPASAGDVPFLIGATAEPDGAPAGPLGELESLAVWRRRLVRDDVVSAFLRHGGVPPADGRSVEGYAPERAWRYDPQSRPELRPGTASLCVGPGRCYVDGRLCEQRLHVLLGASDGVPQQPTDGPLFAFVDVWDQYVSAFEDPSIADVALGGVDTTGRVGTVARVAVGAFGPTQLSAGYAANEDRGEIAITADPGQLPDNALYRFEVHAGGAAGFTDDDPSGYDADLQREDGTSRGTLTVGGVQAPWPSGTFLEIVGTRTAAGAATMRVIAACDDRGSVYAVDDVPPDAPPALRVRPIASMLWSRENAHGIFSIVDIVKQQGSTRVFLRDEAMRSGLLGVEAIVVVTSPAWIAAAKPGILTRIDAINTDSPGTVVVDLAGALPDPGPGATLRAWDGVIPVDAGAARPFAANELGVRFAAVGTYRSGDFWNAMIRADAAPAHRLDWPTDANGAAVYRPPFGITHAYAPLATLTIGADGVPAVTADLRKLVDAAADMRPEEPRQAPASPVATEPHRAEPAAVPALSPAAPAQPSPPAAVHATLPDTVLLLARHQPDGYEATGAIVEAAVDRPAWRSLRDAPAGGPAQAAAIERVLYALFPSGDLYALDTSDPEASWKACPRYARRRTGATLVAADGKLYVVGGTDERRRPLRAIDVYDAHAQQWETLTTPLRIGRSRAIAAVAGRTLVVCGGERRTWFGLRHLSSTFETYDLDAGRSRSIGRMPERRADAGAVAIRGAVYVSGGAIAANVFDRAGRATARVDRLHLRTGGWSGAAMLAEPQRAPAAALVGPDEFAVLDRDGDAAERIRVRFEDGVALPALKAQECGVAAIDGVLYAVAGTIAGRPSAGVWACAIVDRLRVFRHTRHHRHEGAEHGTARAASTHHSP
ncbi:MAG: hypothetical protein JWO85_655 [Candidatus Eremiobacteraeota bacterium]|nr:hypothetical protein [Candidatus Eremiobacteraeota bacterium]